MKDALDVVLDLQIKYIDINEFKKCCIDNIKVDYNANGKEFSLEDIKTLHQNCKDLKKKYQVGGREEQQSDDDNDQENEAKRQFFKLYRKKRRF